MKYSTRRRPITERKSGSKPRGLGKSTQRVISTFHTITKKLSNDHTLSEQDKETLKSQLEEELGGLEGYQRASLKGGSAQHGKSASRKWLLPRLQQHRKEMLALDFEKDIKLPQLDMLDIGAIDGKTWTSESSWLHCFSIDLNPLSPLVIKQDFLQRPLPTPVQASSSHNNALPNSSRSPERFDIVSASLVVNFIGSLVGRGEFLFRIWHFLKPSALFYLVLPAPCVHNSRYLTHAALVEFLDRTCALEVAEHHTSPRLVFYLCRRKESNPPKRIPFHKVERNPGAKRNNFCIVLRAEEETRP